MTTKTSLWTLFGRLAMTTRRLAGAMASGNATFGASVTPAPFQPPKRAVTACAAAFGSTSPARMISAFFGR